MTIKMRNQPTWPDREPDKITDMVGGGFVDGRGNRHYMPVAIMGLDVSVVKDANGIWHWHSS